MQHRAPKNLGISEQANPTIDHGVLVLFQLILMSLPYIFKISIY